MRSKTIFGERSLRRALSEYVEHFPASANWHTDGAQISFPPKGYQVAQGGAAAQLRESEKLQSAVGSSYERMRLRGLKRCDQTFHCAAIKQNYDLRTNSRPIAIIRRSCSDSLLTASQMV
jgi:hypothetical protein